MLEANPSIYGSPPSLSDTKRSHHRAVERVISAMRQRLDEEFSLQEMANVAFMSPFHFNRIFRQVTGVPPCQFMSALRLESARRLLLTTKLSVTEVCFEVGYSSLGTFTRRFTDLLGISPRSLRRLAKLPASPPPVRATPAPVRQSLLEQRSTRGKRRPSGARWRLCSKPGASRIGAAVRA